MERENKKVLYIYAMVKFIQKTCFLLLIILILSTRAIRATEDREENEKEARAKYLQRRRIVKVGVIVSGAAFVIYYLYKVNRKSKHEMQKIGDISKGLGEKIQGVGQETRTSICQERRPKIFKGSSVVIAGVGGLLTGACVFACPPLVSVVGGFFCMLISENEKT